MSLLAVLILLQEPSEKLVQRIGREPVELIQGAVRAEAYLAGKMDWAKRGTEGTVGGRILEGAAVKLNGEQLTRLKEILLMDSTYFNQDSKGTKRGIGIRLWTEDGRCLEVSYCLSKGNINLVAKAADGSPMKLRKDMPGGFRNDKAHPIRPFTAGLFPDNPDVAKYGGVKETSPEPAPPAVNPLVAPGARVEKVAEGFTFAEGPAAAPNGDLFFVDFRRSLIFRWDVAKGTLATVTDDSHGTNGMQFDADGRLVGCQGDLRRVVAFDPESGKVVAVLADTYGGKRYNNPNDLWIHPDGFIYFTDPAYSRKKADLEMDGRHVYCVSPGGRKVIRVADDYNTPNGIVGTPDGKRLYITDRRLGRTWRYAIGADGTLSDKRPFCKVGADGMTLDEKGNLYTTPRANALRVFDPEGRELAPIPLPSPASNVCFAGADRKTLFITTAKALYSIRMAVSGQ